MAAPERTCVGCRTRRPQDELLRVVRSEDGQLAVDRNGPGRGAWLCAATAPDCCDQATRRKAWGRALRAVETTAAERLRSNLAVRARL